MKYSAPILILVLALNAFAQSDERTGFTFGVQSGIEYLDYTESFTSVEHEAYIYSGSTYSVAGTVSIEYDLSRKFNAPFFVAISAGFPIRKFSGDEYLTVSRGGLSYVTQKNEVEHEYNRFRGFFGFNANPVFSPFVLFERSLLESTRWNRLKGTDEGQLVPDWDSAVTWRERVWSSHFGAGFQGGIPLVEGGLLSVTYRLAATFALASFVTNDHPQVYYQGRKLGRDASGFTALARVALRYDWHPQSSLQFGVSIYSRNWEGDGESVPNAVWPANTMDAIPVLLGVTWSI